jgi:hypothetical protein
MMRSSFRGLAFALALACASVLPLSAQAVGPDVIVGSIPDVSTYTAVGGINAYAIGTTSCNVGTQPLLWQANTTDHPVIAQNLYRLANGRFEMIGISWLKHGFTALAQNLCATCQNPGTGALLGVNCSDPYSSGLNGSQSGLGPRFEVNATTGIFVYPFTSPAYSGTIARRLQVLATDVNPTTNPGAQYWVEGHYIARDDAAAGNKNNNASYRKVTFTTAANNPISLTGTTFQQQAGIMAWGANDTGVTYTNYDDPQGGRFIVAEKHAANHHEYAVYNMNSDRSAGSFTVNMPAGFSATGLGFHDVFYHSGEPWDGTDWAATTASNGIQWATTPYATNPNANALRWSTMYNFRFDSAQMPTGWSIGLFKPAPCATVPYTWTSGYTVVNGAPYTFENIFATGTAGPTGDDTSLTANVGFAFPFYGSTYTQMQIGSNGYLAIPGQNANAYTNTSLPNAAAPNGIVCGYWTDLNPGAAGSGQIRYQTTGTAPNRRFIVHYNGVYRYGTTQAENFQIILEETGKIYLTTVLSSSTGSVGTRGAEDQTGTNAALASFNVAGSMGSNTTTRIDPQAGIPYSAGLTVTGNGAPNSVINISLLGAANTQFAPCIVAVDVAGGPVTFPGVGTFNLGFTPSMFMLAPPGSALDGCRFWGMSIPTGGGLPPGINLFLQAVVFDAAAPNGQFHVSTPATFNS